MTPRVPAWEKTLREVLRQTRVLWVIGLLLGGTVYAALFGATEPKWAAYQVAAAGALFLYAIRSVYQLPKKRVYRYVARAAAVVLWGVGFYGLYVVADRREIALLIGPSRIQVVAVTPEHLTALPVRVRVLGDQQVLDAHVSCFFENLVFPHGTAQGNEVDLSRYVPDLKAEPFTCSPFSFFGSGDPDAIKEASFWFGFEFSVPEKPERYWIANRFQLVRESAGSGTRIRWQLTTSCRGREPARFICQ